MKFVELLEGAEPKMPGAPGGIKIMTPQQFVASAGDAKSDKEEPEEELKEFSPRNDDDHGDDPGEEDDGLDIDENQLSRIRSLSGLGEATKLPAQTRDLGGQEFQDYMNRIVGTPDLDKSGNVKVDKKGNEKYVSGKTKADKYKMPYIHRSSVVTYLSPDGKTYNEDAVKQTLAQRPKSLLKQNEKMKHSNGELEQFFNVGFAALVGIALDEQTNNLIIVNTCPGAGSCKVECFAMKGGKIQFKAAWQSDGRILTYLLNDPDGFFNQLSSEISKEEQLGKKGGYKVTIRWHDAGDFFSPEYQKLAFDMAAKHPDTKFYAYTKIAKAALGDKPDNFTVNWSEGAHTSQEKQVKANDANLDTTKNSRIVPDNLFQDLLVKDEKGNLVKGGEGQWQVEPEKLPELKQRLAKQYQLSANSILSYDEYTAKRKSIPAGMKYNVIVAPGEGDISANDPNIISTLLLRH
jgi:Gene product 88